MDLQCAVRRGMNIYGNTTEKKAVGQDTYDSFERIQVKVSGLKVWTVYLAVL